MRAAARFDGLDARGRQRGVPGEEFGVFPREDVVGDGGDAVGIAEGEAEGEHEGRFAGADGAALVRFVVSEDRGFLSFSLSLSPFFPLFLC